MEPTKDADTKPTRHQRAWSGQDPAIELRHLRYFIAVSEELHFRRAAERLHMAQPPLSQAIRKLEAELGTTLFRRTSRVVTLTEAGRVFAEQARLVLADFDRAVAECRRSGGGTTLRIGSAPLLPIQPLLRFLGALHGRDPSPHTQVSHLLAPEQVRRLRDEQLHLGILSYVEQFHDLEMEPLFPGEPLAAFLPPDHRLAGEEAITPELVVGDALVTAPREANPALHNWLLETAAAAGYRFRGVHEAGGIDGRDLFLAVAGGAGIALLPRSLKDANQAGGIVTVRPLDPPLSMPETVIVWRSQPPLQLKALLGVARETARQLHERGIHAPAD